MLWDMTMRCWTLAVTGGIVATVVGGLTLGMGGCASHPSEPDVAAGEGRAEAPVSPSLTLPSGSYAAGFDAMKATLRDMGFLLERVDAQGGVITTQPKGTAGLATPWDKEQSGVDQELDDLFHRQQRVVRVEFTPRGSGQGQEVTDLRAYTGEVDVLVQAAAVRWYKPGQRINTGSITSSTYAEDPALTAQGLSWYSVAQSQDYRLAARIAERVMGKVAAAEPASP